MAKSPNGEMIYYMVRGGNQVKSSQVKLNKGQGYVRKHIFGGVVFKPLS